MLPSGNNLIALVKVSQSVSHTQPEPLCKSWLSYHHYFLPYSQQCSDLTQTNSLSTKLDKNYKPEGANPIAQWTTW